MAHFGQTVGCDGQPEQSGLILVEDFRESSSLEIVGNEWVVRRLDAVLHRQVKTRGRFPTAGNTDQDDIGA